MIRNGMDKNRGFVLLVALGVLGVLGLLAATFATLSRVERAVSNSYVDKVRAKMLAQSGVERAIASIRGRAMVQAWDDTRNDWYYREMLNLETGTLKSPPSVKTAIWKYTPTRAYGMPPRSLEASLDDGLVNGVANGISFPQAQSPTVYEPFSGQFPGTYESRGDVYALKVLDCASMINVNDGGKNITRVLTNLGNILKCADGTLVNLGGFDLGLQIQTKAIARQKPFNNKAEVLDAVFINNSFFTDKTDARKRFDAVKSFITCHGWVDGMTIKFNNTWTGATDYIGGNYASACAAVPAPSDGTEFATAPVKTETAAVATDPVDQNLASNSASTGFASNPLFSISMAAPGSYASLPSTRILAAPAVFKVKDPLKGGGFRQFVTAQGANAVMGGETAAGKFGGSSYQGEPRTPVNVNTASKEVLVATLMNLEADFWDYQVVTEAVAPGVKREYNGRLGNINVKITQVDAENIADFLISARFTNGSPAGAWSFNDWMHFEDDVILKIPGLTRFQAALVKANANPNTNIKKLDPDLILITSNPSVNPDELVRMDKSDIKVNSTEWTFSSNGIFEIESIGRVYSSGKVMAEEKIETVVKVFDQVVYTTQEQFEANRIWTPDTGSETAEGDLLAGGYPPIVSMPEYLYNPASNPKRYRNETPDVTWCADYEGYMILNGPAKVQAGDSPNPGTITYGEYDETKACWGPNPALQKMTPVVPSAKKCGISFVAGFNMASLYPTQSHHNAIHLSSGPRHPEYGYTSPHCFADGASMSAQPAHSSTDDTTYTSGSTPLKKARQIDPAQSGANFWDNGSDLGNFGVYINEERRNRFHTYWADELPSPDCTIEMTVKPEIDLWSWANKSKPHTISSGWGAPYQIMACKRQFLFDWGTGGTAGMNYTIRAYAELTRVYIEFVLAGATPKFYVLWTDHNWKPHTWHHVEFSWLGAVEVTKADGSKVTVPPNAMMFVDGNTNPEGAASMFSPDVNKDLNTFMGYTVVSGAALILPFNVHPANPNNNVGSGPRFDVGGILANDGSFGMSSPRWHGIIDNIIMHHWRAHTASFTTRNRYHSTTYYDGALFKSGEGYKKETAGVYKKQLLYLEQQAALGDLTVGTVGCAHYHPFHVHLYGHDGSAPTTSFGHITPALRIKTGGSYVDSYYYDGCVGVPVKAQIKSGNQVFYLGFFEVASLVPVTFTPILCDIRITYFQEPQTLYRLSSAEAKK